MSSPAIPATFPTKFMKTTCLFNRTKQPEKFQVTDRSIFQDMQDMLKASNHKIYTQTHSERLPSTSHSKATSKDRTSILNTSMFPLNNKSTLLHLKCYKEQQPILSVFQTSKSLSIQYILFLLLAIRLEP